jgi:hypothetical protein
VLLANLSRKWARCIYFTPPHDSHTCHTPSGSVCMLYELQSVNVHALDYELNIFKCLYFLSLMCCSPTSFFFDRSFCMWLQILLLVTMKITSFSNVASGRYHCFGETCFLPYQGSWLILAKHAGNVYDGDCVLGCESSRCFKAPPKYWHRCEITLCHISEESRFSRHTFILGVPDRIMCTFLGHFPQYPIPLKVFPFVHLT